MPPFFDKSIGNNHIMVTFSVALALLIIGYIVYGGFVNRIFGPDPKRETPAVAMNDGVDYIPMPTWKIFAVFLMAYDDATFPLSFFLLANHSFA